MRHFSPSPFLMGLALAGLVFQGCRSKEEAGSPPPPRSAQGVEGFYQPQTNESWTYAGTRSFPPGTNLSPADAEQARELPNGALVIDFERRRVCSGTYRPENADRDLTSFDIYDDGILSEREIYDITAAGVIGRGWAPAEIDLSDGVLLNPGVKIAIPGMTGGQSWSVASKDSGRFFNLQVIERADITVPAGTFEAARLRITANGQDRSTKRTIWFAENVGIVKEEVIHYDRQQVRVREQMELVLWALPTLTGQPSAPPRIHPSDDTTAAVPSSNPLGITHVSTTTPLGHKSSEPEEEATESTVMDSAPAPTGDTAVTPPETGE